MEKNGNNQENYYKNTFSLKKIFYHDKITSIYNYERMDING